MSEARFIVGDSLKVLRTLPDASVDLVFSSPPFLALRSYLPADHPDKDAEIGAEATPADFVDALLDVVEECRRVLTSHGTLCFELGDTYSGTGGVDDVNDVAPRPARMRQMGGRGNGYSGHKADTKHGDDALQVVPLNGGPGWPMEKSLALIPESFRWALAYGRNPFNGRETPRWRVRNVIRWCRPNPSPGDLGDKVRPATSDIAVACTAADRYFDLDAVRTVNHPERMHEGSSPQRNRQGGMAGLKGAGSDADPDYRSNRSDRPWNPGGAPPLDYWWVDDVDDLFEQDAWEIATRPFRGSHYATFPKALVVRPVKAMCPERVCTTCGEPSRRIIERSAAYAAAREAIGDGNQRGDGQGVSGSRSVLNKAAGRNMTSAEHVTLGWTHCDCGDGCTSTSWRIDVVEVEQGKAADGKWYDLDKLSEEPSALRTKRKRKRVVDVVGECADESHWRRGIVLDPFAGSGTTLVVATGHGRDAVGIDLDARNADLAHERLGMFLTEVEYR